ncbi:hypothetical protein [Amorphus coralli]|uniref:hypothetical protein n=1 Tax=Amorphus coralli TaxID=340680 RepID=UPI000360447D|nr:hypothetical protein [Amorphus coralli]
MSLLVAIVALALTTLAFLVTILLFNRPGLGTRLRREAVVMPVSKGFTGGFALTFAFVQQATMQLPFPVWANVLAGTAVSVATIVAVCLATRFAARARPPVAPPPIMPTAA